MKKAYLFALFLLCTLPYSVSGYGSYSQNQLNTTNTEQNITITTAPSWEIVWIEIPRRANITSAEWNFTDYYVREYQENYTTITTTGSWQADSYLITDGDWSSFSRCGAGSCNMFLYYDKPSNADGAIWEASYYGPIDGQDNLTLPNTCLDNETILLKVTSSETGHLTSFQCLNGTDIGDDDHYTILFTNTSNHHVYEEAVWWHVYPENITIDTGNDGSIDYINTTLLNTTETINLNYTAINNYLHDTCTANWATGSCDVPFNVTSVSNGTLGISVISLSGSYLETFGSCSDSGYYDALYFWFHEEVTLNGINGSAEYTIEDTGGASIYNTSVSNTPNFTICSLGDASYTVNMTMIYWNATSDQRSYYFYHATVTNTSTQNISLYLIPSADSEKVEITVRDANDNTVEDAYVNIQRYYVDENQYRTVTIGKTDGTGKFLTYLYPDTVYYKFIVSIAGTVSNTYTPMTITDTADDPETLTLYTTVGVTQFFDVRENVGGSCYTNYTTNYTICTVADATGLLTSARLIVEHSELAGPETICDTTGTGSAITLSCFLGDDANGTYSHKLMGVPSPNPPYVLATGYAYFTETNIFGDYGLFPAFMLVLAISSIAIFNPAIGALMAVIGLGAGVALGVIEISGAALVSLLAVAMIIFMKGRGV